MRVLTATDASSAMTAGGALNGSASATAAASLAPSPDLPGPPELPDAAFHPRVLHRWLSTVAFSTAGSGPPATGLTVFR